MSLLASFIGINRYSDPSIRELTGARRDAEALWALFSDSVPNLQARAIVDAEATVENIRKTLDTTLRAATSNDTVIISFSGHGTPNHQIVAHDTDLKDLVNTTIPMQELATLFQTSNAKKILFILDCCFSGGAPAKVLNNVPIARNARITIDVIAGEGRIWLTASKENEPAYELPGSGHGLLTKAFIDVLQAATTHVNILEASAEIMAKVRNAAQKIGRSQTPVFLGQITGKLLIPPLKAGQNFFTKFPAATGQKIGANIQELAQFGLPEGILSQWSSQFQSLNDLQLQAVNDRQILEGASLLVIAPTGSGKTFIGELAATKAICEGRKAVFLLPYRALTNEKYEQFLQVYEKNLGMRVIRCCGDYVDQTHLFVRGKYDLAVLTYEMFLNLMVNNPVILNQLGLVVLDEAQFITDPSRGINVELLLTYLRTVKQRGFNIQLIALSAVVGDINYFDEWLECKKLVTNQRPVPLIEGVLDRTGIFQFLDSEGRQKLEQLLPPNTIRQRKKEPSNQDIIVPLVRLLIQNNENAIVFRNTRGKAQGCANYLARDLDLPYAREAIEALPQQDISTASIVLRECLRSRTAFHNTNLTREEKEVVEQFFRNRGGQVRVLAATTTLAAGVNTPASTVILAEHKFFNGRDLSNFTVAEYKNMAGRAGRIGYSKQGTAILLANHSQERQFLFDRYVLGQLEPIQSSFDLQNLETWIVRILTQVHQVPRNEVIVLLSNTFGGYLANRKNPLWQNQMEQQLETLIEKMIYLGLIEQEGHKIQLTLLGQAVGSSVLSFSSSMRLVDLIRNLQIDDLTVEKLIALLQVLPESDNGYTPMMKRGYIEESRPQETAKRYGNEILIALQRFARDRFDYLARCKRASLIWDWINGESIEEIEQKYSPNPSKGKIEYGDILRFVEATRFHLRSAHQIISLIRIGQSPTAEEIAIMLKQLEVGIPADALDLLSIPLRLNRGEYLTLYKTGIETMNDLWLFSEMRLSELLGKKRAAQLEYYRPKRQEFRSQF
ncbi:MAG: DEAD/DEAH box helicase [Cyanobacteria bacterium SBLK]|nr:DEAD/DEAH box helicase [Cyanobacteria bacterium SBLK]